MKRLLRASHHALCCLALISLLCGCASPGRRGNVLAVVNGEPVTEENLAYALNVSHRRDDLSSTAKVVDVRQYLQKLIDDRLLIQEARSWGLDKSPEVVKAVEAFILRESVVKLHQDEIVQKVSVSEEELSDYYRNNYEQFTLGLIELTSEEEARRAGESLKAGLGFEELARKYFGDPAKEKPGEFTFAGRYLAPKIKEVLYKLKPGEFSETVKVGGNYLIVKLIGRKAAPDEKFATERDRIKRELLKLKQKERGDELLKSFREQARIKIDRELLSGVRLYGSGPEHEKLLKDGRTVAELQDYVLTIGELVSEAQPFRPVSGVAQAPDEERIKNDILNRWLEFKLVDRAALSRHYESGPEFKARVDDYRDQLIKGSLVGKAIVAGIDQSDKAAKSYYLSHQKDFLKPARFNVERITVKTGEEAEELLANLKQGASFSWLAKKKSIDSAAEKGGKLGWILKTDLPPSAGDFIDKLKPGETGPVFETDGNYAVLRLLERSPEEVEDFDAAREAVNKASFLKQYKELFDKQIARLRADAEIDISEETVKAFELRFK